MVRIKRGKRTKTSRKGHQPHQKGKKPTILRPTIPIISRRGQPQIWHAPPSMQRQNIPITRVSSSWIARLGYKLTGPVSGFAIMELIEGRDYKVYIPWKIMFQWINAHSKGTFFNEMIKDQFKVRKII